MPALRIALQLAGKALKSLGKKAGKNMGPGTKIAIILGIIFFFILMIISFIQTLKVAILCWGLLGKINDECPQPLTDMEQVEKLGEELYTWRNAAVENAYRGGESFRPYAKSQADLEEDERHTEAEMYLIILNQLDTNVVVEYGNNHKFFGENGKLKDTNYGRYMAHAKDKKKKEKINPFFMEKRVETWGCFLLGEVNKDRCKGFVEDDMDAQGYKQGIMLSTTQETYTDGDGNKKVRKKMNYPALKSILDEYFEISLYNGLENGRERYDEEVDAILMELEFFENFPPQNTGKYGGGFSFGWANPMEEGTYNSLTSPFGMRLSPTFGVMMLHAGVDLGAPTGVPIYSTKAGMVISVTPNHPVAGGTVTIEHSGGYYSTYKHMRTNDIVVSVGQEVAQGQLIGAVSGVGKVTGPHLHFELCTMVNALGCMQSQPAAMDPEGDPFNIDFRSPSFDAGLQSERMAQFDNEWRSAAKNGEVIIREGIMLDVGTLTMEHESGDDPGICVWWEPSKGGTTCGAYQIETSHGTMKEFINFLEQHFPEFANEMNKYPVTKSGQYYANSSHEGFSKNFRRIYDSDPDGFFMAQHMFITNSHFYGVSELLERKGVFYAPDMPRGIREMIHSMGVQHRNNTQNIIAPQAGVTDGRWRTMTFEQIAQRMYDARSANWPDYINSRYKPELAAVLQMLDDEGVRKTIAGEY